MAAPTIIYLSTGKVGTNGTDKSVPYDHEFLCRQNRYKRNRQARSLQVCVAKRSSALALRETLRFPAQPRTGSPEINVSVAASMRHRNPSAAKQPAPLAGEPMWCGAEFNTALMCGGSFPVSSVTSTPGYRKKRIRSSLKAPLKKRGSHGFARTLEPGHQR